MLKPENSDRRQKKHFLFDGSFLFPIADTYVCKSLLYMKKLRLKYEVLHFNPIRPVGDCPPNLWEALKRKLFEPVIYNFLTIPKYLYTYFDFKIKKLLSFVLWPACWEGFQICRSRIFVHISDIFTFFLSIIHILSY